MLEKIRASGKVGYGFDAYKEVYCDMVASGIVDPTKVTRSALENPPPSFPGFHTTVFVAPPTPPPPPRRSRHGRHVLNA